MKYKLSEHPYIFMVLVALVLVICSITIAALYQWSPYAIVAIVISALGFIVLSYTFLKDLSIYFKQKRKYEESIQEQKKESNHE